MPLPIFGAEAALAPATRSYRGTYRYGARAGGVQPNQLFAPAASDFAYTEMDTSVDDAIAADGEDVASDIGLADDGEDVVLDAEDLELEGETAESDE
jgi:hypothetical protein